MPLVVGTGALRTEDSIEYACMAKDVGADAILVATPPYSVPTGREIALHALAIDRAVDMPVMLYNYPGRMSVNMDEDTTNQLRRDVWPTGVPIGHLLVHHGGGVAVRRGHEERAVGAAAEFMVGTMNDVA